VAYVRQRTQRTPYPRQVILTAFKLRSDIYRFLDQVIETGEPIVIERNGRRLRIVADEARSRLSRLIARPGVGVGEDLVHLDWSHEWSADATT
jgi:hypothetical protein